MLQRLARFCYRRRRWVLGGWIVLLVATFALASSLSGAFKTEFKLPGTESQAAFDLLEKSSFRNRQIQAQIVFGSKDGVETVGMTMYTDIYVRRDGAWKCIQAQITPVAPANYPPDETIVRKYIKGQAQG